MISLLLLGVPGLLGGPELIKKYEPTPKKPVTIEPPKEDMAQVDDLDIYKYFLDPETHNRLVCALSKLKSVDCVANEVTPSHNLLVPEDKEIVEKEVEDTKPTGNGNKGLGIAEMMAGVIGAFIGALGVAIYDTLM